METTIKGLGFRVWCFVFCVFCPSSRETEAVLFLNYETPGSTIDSRTSIQDCKFWSGDNSTALLPMSKSSKRRVLLRAKPNLALVWELQHLHETYEVIRWKNPKPSTLNPINPKP